jgi:hypothetical protein
MMEEIKASIEEEAKAPLKFPNVIWEPPVITALKQTGRFQMNFKKVNYKMFIICKNKIK